MVLLNYWPMVMLDLTTESDGFPEDENCGRAIDKTVERN